MYNAYVKVRSRSCYLMQLKSDRDNGLWTSWQFNKYCTTVPIVRMSSVGMFLAGNVVHDVSLSVLSPNRFVSKTDRFTYEGRRRSVAALLKNPLLFILKPTAAVVALYYGWLENSAIGSQKDLADSDGSTMG